MPTATLPPRQPGTRAQPARWALVGLLLLLQACGEKEELDTNLCLFQPQRPTPGYTADIQPMLESHCLGCHSVSVQGLARLGAPESVNFDTRSDVMRWSERMRQQLMWEAMPPAFLNLPPMDSESRCLIVDWIDQGMPE